MNDASPAKYFIKQAGLLGSGFLFAAVGLKIFPTKAYNKLSRGAILIVGGAVFFVALYGKVMNGANNWLFIKGYGVQPSEAAKVLIIPLYAWYYKKDKYFIKSLKAWIPPIISIIIGILIVMQNDYGTALIFMVLSFVMFFLTCPSKEAKKLAFKYCAFGGLAFGAMILMFGNRILDQDKIDRFNFFNPCERYLNTGNQLCNGYIAINGGGLIGKGLGNSTQKYLYLPESHTDFIFAIFIEELGLAGGIVLILMYAYVIYKIIDDGKKTTSLPKRNICYGVAIYIALHVFINLGGVLGLIPVTGIPLPFLSYGGTYCWCLIAALAMVQRVVYETNTNKD
jgi:Bacterial cell division membrane protein